MYQETKYTHSSCGDERKVGRCSGGSGHCSEFNARECNRENCPTCHHSLLSQIPEQGGDGQRCLQSHLPEWEIQKAPSFPQNTATLKSYQRDRFPHFTKTAPKPKGKCPNEIHLQESHNTAASQSTNARNCLLVLPGSATGEMIHLYTRGWGLWVYS